jgi:hypothetical protein
MIYLTIYLTTILAKKQEAPLPSKKLCIHKAPEIGYNFHISLWRPAISGAAVVQMILKGSRL